MGQIVEYLVRINSLNGRASFRYRNKEEAKAAFESYFEYHADVELVERTMQDRVLEFRYNVHQKGTPM